MTEESSSSELNAGQPVPNKEDTHFPLLGLPNQLLNLILSYLSTRDLLAFQLTSKQATEIVTSFHQTKHSSHIPIKLLRKQKTTASKSVRDSIDVSVSPKPGLVMRTSSANNIMLLATSPSNGSHPLLGGEDDLDIVPVTPTPPSPSTTSTPISSPMEEPNNQKQRAGTKKGKELKPQDIAEFAKQSRNAIDSFVKLLIKKKQPADDQRDAVFDYLNQLQETISMTSFVLRDNMNVGKLKDELQVYLWTKIYKLMFENNSEYHAADEALSQRIASFKWVTPQHLDIKQESWNQDLWDTAVTEFSLLNSWITPAEKLACVFNCAKILIFLLQDSGTTTTADDFLPHMIYITLRANVPNLQTNIHFITAFTDPEEMNGEAFYFFTNLVSSVAFINILNASFLNIDVHDYNKFMGIPDPANNPSSAKIKDKKASGKALKLLGVDPSKDKVKDKLGVDENALKNPLTPTAQRERSKTLAPPSSSQPQTDNNNNNAPAPDRRLSLEKLPAKILDDLNLNVGVAKELFKEIQENVDFSQLLGTAKLPFPVAPQFNRRRSETDPSALHNSKKE